MTREFKDMAVYAFVVTTGDMYICTEGKSVWLLVVEDRARG